MTISDVTAAQLGALTCDPRKPLVICDVDEVVVHFTRGFETFLEERGLWLDTSSLALDGNIRRRSDGSAVDRAVVATAINGYFTHHTASMEPIDGAVEALHAIAETATLVFLSNLPHTSGEDRRRNLRSFGFNQPLITNEGPKGPAIRALAARTVAETVFIDDSPGFISSAYQHAPSVHLVHFMHDERFARHIQPFDYVSLFTHDWQAVRPHVLDLVTRQP